MILLLMLGLGLLVLALVELYFSYIHWSQDVTRISYG